MIRSVVVLGALVLALVLGGRALLSRPSEPVATVDYQQTAEQVRKVAPFDVLTPTSMPDGWRATTVDYEPGSGGRWHLGVLTDEKEYVGLEQTPMGVRATVEQFAAETRPDGKTRVDGHTWRVRSSAAGETTLVRRADEVTILVTGTAPRKQIEEYVELLSTG